MSPGSGRVAFEGPVRAIGAVVRRRRPDAAEVLARVARLCAEHGVTLRVDVSEPEVVPDGVEPLDLAREPVDLVVALGGDGTLLRAVRMVRGRDVPVFGVNLGALGFLTTTAEADLERGLAQVLEGQGILDRRLTLEAHVCGGDGSRELHAALNDVVVHRPGAARMSALNLSVGEGEERDDIGSFSADGVIIATPTGSTAYSLSAGGPIITPDMECLVITAICPHSLAVRPLVVPAVTSITIRPLDPTQELQVTMDGQIERPLEPGETVVVSPGRHRVSLVRLPGQTFFGTMRRKLNWAARPPERA